MAHQESLGHFLMLTRVSKTNGKDMFVLLIFMLMLYWQIGYIINAAKVCKYIRSYVMCKQ